MGLPSGKRLKATVITLKAAREPKLRFDRSAVGFVMRLRTALAQSAPKGKTVVVTCTAPIWQDSKTSKILETEIERLFAKRKTRLQATILGNQVQARIVKGGPGGLIGFIHNPEPGAEAVFDLTRALLRSLARRSHPRGEALVIRNQGHPAPIRALGPMCEALGLKAIFPKIFVTGGDDLRPLY